jgi:hypothetical protein
MWTNQMMHWAGVKMGGFHSIHFLFLNCDEWVDETSQSFLETDVDA